MPFVASHSTTGCFDQDRKQTIAYRLRVISSDILLQHTEVDTTLLLSFSPSSESNQDQESRPRISNQTKWRGGPQHQFMFSSNSNRTIEGNLPRASTVPCPIHAASSDCIVNMCTSKYVFFVSYEQQWKWGAETNVAAFTTNTGHLLLESIMTFSSDSRDSKVLKQEIAA